jgi:alpha-ribazole phosphatase/probable phosphoglycerate mutase
MFGFLKKKLKEGIEKITKTISEKEEEKIKEVVEEVKKEEHLKETKEELVKEVEKEIEKPEEIKEVEEKPFEGVKITYFIHGSTVDNEKELASGWADAELSDLGKKQSIELKDLIKEKKFDFVFCSDFARAVDSAKLTFGDSFNIIQDKRLREVNYGDLTRTDSKKVYSQMLEHINKPFPNGESYRDVERRIAEFLNYLLENYYGKSVAIVAHRAPQLALDVLLKGKTWEQAIKEDWRLTKKWQPGWEYEIRQKIEIPEVKGVKAPEAKIEEKAEAKIEEAKEIVETAKEIEKIPEAKIEEKPKKGFFE